MQDIFKCSWFRINLAGDNPTLVQDPFGFSRLKTTGHWRTTDVFVFPSHVEQCYYIPYPLDQDNWSIVVTHIPRSRSIVQESSPAHVVIEDDDAEVEG